MVDNVTLTIDTKLQSQVAAALDQHAPGVLGAAAVVLNPKTGAVEAMYSNPTYDPNPLVSQDLATETTAWTTYLNPTLCPGNPLVSRHLRQVYPPGLQLQGGHRVGRLEHRPDLAKMIYPTVSSVHRCPSSGGQVLTNYHNGACGAEPAEAPAHPVL